MTPTEKLNDLIRQTLEAIFAAEPIEMGVLDGSTLNDLGIQLAELKDKLLGGPS